MFKIYNGAIHGAETEREIIDAGYSKCDKCGGTNKCPWSNCLHYLSADYIGGEYVGGTGWCTTKKENKEYDVTRYGVGRV